MPVISGYHHVGLSVTDLAKSTEWYRTVLELEVFGGAFDAAIAAGWSQG